MMCGLAAAMAPDTDTVSSDNAAVDVDCVACMRDLIADLHLNVAGGEHDSPADTWAAGGDTGISSLTIWSVMTGCPMPRGLLADVPYDPADFGRCHRLLLLIPEWRPRLHEVAKRHPEWAVLVDCWSSLTDLYLQELPFGNAPRLWGAMRDAIGQSRHG